MITYVKKFAARKSRNDITYVGIDPGLSGAIAFVDEDRVRTIDTPTKKVFVSGKNRTVHIVEEMWKIVSENCTKRNSVVLEEVTPDPRFGSTNFSYGSGVGFWVMAFAGNYIRIHRVRPQVWKKEVGIPARSGKRASRLLAQKLFPKDKDLFNRVKDDGRADAALMAYWLKNRRVRRFARIRKKKR